MDKNAEQAYLNPAESGSYMTVIGLTGGIASGKSFVASCLVRLGAQPIDADRIAHEVLCNPNVVSRIVGQWGDSVLDQSGKIDRSLLGEKVFSDSANSKAQLELLESITHPEIRRRILERLEELKSLPGVELIVLDIPLLFEGGWEQECDEVIFVDASLDVRKQRAAARGWDDDELQTREESQIPVAEKKSKASWTIDNSGIERETVAQLLEFLRTRGLLSVEN